MLLDELIQIERTKVRKETEDRVRKEEEDRAVEILMKLLDIPRQQAIMLYNNSGVRPHRLNK